MRTASSGHARWRDTNELAVGRTSTTSASSASLGRVGDRGLTGALPARELSDIVAQLARSLAADAAVSDYAYPDVRENFAQAPDPGQAGSWLSLRICLSKTVVGA